MKFTVSKAAECSFDDGPRGCKPAVLIHASTKKIHYFFAKTDAGYYFFNSPGGVEKPVKLAKAKKWLQSNSEVWAPVIDLRGPNPEKFFFADGRHTFIALYELSYKCIEVAVPNDRASELAALLACDRT